MSAIAYPLCQNLLRRSIWINDCLLDLFDEIKQAHFVLQLGEQRFQQAVLEQREASPRAGEAFVIGALSGPLHVGEPTWDAGRCVTGSLHIPGGPDAASTNAKVESMHKGRSAAHRM